MTNLPTRPSTRPPDPTGEIAGIRGLLAAVRSRVTLADGDTFARAAALRNLDEADRDLVLMARGQHRPTYIHTVATGSNP